MKDLLVKITQTYWNLFRTDVIKNFDCIPNFNGFNQKNLFGVFCYKLCQSTRVDNIQFLSKIFFPHKNIHNCRQNKRDRKASIILRCKSRTLIASVWKGVLEYHYSNSR